jgi:hypothetical protein
LVANWRICFYGTSGWRCRNCLVELMKQIQLIEQMKRTRPPQKQPIHNRN